ncbi:Hypothetical protein NTJ_10847 [Nesidiocoris tenuis]|uniref:LEM domain-containing protein n=2 Tax=Nesidiocoris tenuis TaxID=355587 RepID=A0ABN7B0T6_9HEMI|nr:Hypothetical protein NTJ_10847 [Nesidiocoris tenuis]
MIQVILRMDSPETKSERSDGDNRSRDGSSSSHKDSRRSSSSSSSSSSNSSRPDGDSIDSFDHQHVYANPALDVAPEIPEVDYPTSRRNSTESKSNFSNRSTDHPPTPTTRRSSDESVIIHGPVEQRDPRFYTIPLQDYPYPPASETGNASAEDEPVENFWKFFMYGILILAAITAIVLIIWASVYYSS